MRSPERADALIAALHGGLIVSCQAAPGNPLHGPVFMAAMAKAAERGGAAGIRAEGVEDLAAIRRETNLPLIGLIKREEVGSPVYLTPGLEDVEAIAAAGARIVAFDATGRPRFDGSTVCDMVERAHRCGCLALADVADFGQGRSAAEAGADLVATTLSGYLGGPVPEEPDFVLVAELAAALSAPVVAEGRYSTPAQAAEALRRGAHAVVVGTALTNPMVRTAAFVRSLRTEG
ncbi:MAG: N-acetylmannosamine-6-phosphate 2-epimerase [Puniceicoccaceae bacterium]|nr:MAG: N-acetylmannosamine-6-phosphate 2-epimerase [Puniceicoccaceae bacterium]